MDKKLFSIGAMALALTLAAPLASRAADKEENEQKVAWADVPAPVQKTLTREAFGAHIATVDKERFKGKTAFEADVKIDGHNYEIVVDEHGLLLTKGLDEEDEGAASKGQKKAGENSEKEEKE